MMIHQGDIYWVHIAAPGDADPGYPHPCVVLQADILNQSRIPTVVVCAITSNLKRAKSPGNVLLEASEASLPKQSVVEVSKVSTVEKAQLGEYIGRLSGQRIDQILAGMGFLQTMTGPQEHSDARGLGLGGIDTTEIEHLWAEHLKSPFPTGYAGEEIEGIDLMLLDAGIAGCVSTFIQSGHEYPYRLGAQQTALLGRYYHDARIVLPFLDGAAKEYVSRLEKAAGLILEWISSYERNS